MIKLEEVPLRVYCLALDADQCTYNPLCLSKYPEMKEPRVFHANTKLFDKVKKKVVEENFHVLIITSWSNRQSFPLDYAMSHRNYPTPYFFISLNQIRDEFSKQLPGVRVEVMPLLLSDIDNDLEAGSSFYRGLAVYSVLSKKVEGVQSLCDRELHPRVNRIDGTKFNIFYPQVHAVGNKYDSNKDHFVLYHVADDNTKILKGYEKLLGTAEGLRTFPDQMQVVMTQYDGDYCDNVINCVGTGRVDPYYRSTTKAILGELRNAEYKVWENTPASNRTSNFMLLPDPHLARDLLNWRQDNAKNLESTPLEFKTFPPLPLLPSLFTPTPQTVVNDSPTKFAP